MKIEVEIEVDDEEIEVNEFVQSIIGKAIVGAISSLHGVKEKWKDIKISVRKG